MVAPPTFCNPRTTGPVLPPFHFSRVRADFSRLMGWYTIIISPGASSWLSDQIPTEYKKVPTALTPESTVVVLQLGNVFLLLMALAIQICCFTTGPTVRGYLAIVAVADLGHIYGAYVGMGPEAFWDYGSWNSAIYGAVAGSAILCVNRVATVLGLFGALRG